ncbi:MAG TPA: DUF1178 family protein [Casimicrobiaceae bacterium]|nr:DUF1178 family protein [Casimicrobiaceae bacterium]
MIIFELSCAHGHRFEGWFASGEEFARQQERSLVTCPICDDAHIERLPSARVSVPKGAARDNAPPAESTEERNTTENAALGLPAEAVAKLREIVRNTENVGRRFPEEARKIHYRETPPRAIRGQASRDEAQALTEEGIEFASLPPFLTNDTH